MKLDHRFYRELYIRGGVMLIVAAIAYWILGAEAWVWWMPVVVSALVLIKWLLWPERDDPSKDEGL